MHRVTLMAVAGLTLCAAALSGFAGPAHASNRPNRPAAYFKRAGFDGVTFLYGSSLAQSVTGQVMTPASSNPHLFPRHVTFTFRHYIVSPSEGVLNVYPVNQISKGNRSLISYTGAHTLVAMFRTSLSAVQTVPRIDDMEVDELVQARIHVLHFSNGSGISYITAEAPGRMPISNGILYYKFAGVTSDSRYVITATFPLKAAGLPAQPQPLSAQQAARYNAYLKSVSQKLNTMANTSFVPYPSNLDVVFHSLSVHPRGIGG